MNAKLKFFLVIGCLFFAMSDLTFGQAPGPLSTQSKRAAKAYFEAMDLFEKRLYERVLDKLTKATEEDSNFVEAWLMMGDVASYMKDDNKAIICYRKAIKIDPDFFPNAGYILGNMLLPLGKYDEALQAYEVTANRKQMKAEKLKLVKDKIRICEFAINAMKHPVPFKPQGLGDSINGPYDDYINAITADNLLIYTTIKAPVNNINGRDILEEDFYLSRFFKGVWAKVLPLGPPVNTDGNEGALCISPDGMDMYFAGCNRKDGLGSCDIYHATRIGNSWTVPQNCGPGLNSAKWDTQPSIAPDGKTLYFTSNRPGGKGSSDIWISVLQDDGSWSLPENLGDSINTPELEMNPFIHPDGKTLYFASQGQIGMGGFDLFVSRKKEDGGWSKPLNLGYPINTYYDEINFIVNARGDKAFFSSDKLGGSGKIDIYYFDLYEGARPAMVSYMKGKVFNAETKQALEADFELIDLTTGKTMVRSHSDPQTGEFLVTLPTDKDFALHVTRKGYLFFSENISVKEGNYSNKPYLKDVPLQPVKSGEIVVLHNVFFETDRFELKPESFIELDRLVSLLKKNPDLRIEVSGHTDNVGSDQHNMELSQNRAKVVYDYLVGKLINPSRLRYKGYGETKPMSTNETEGGRKINRRTEFIVLD
jgi:outer membrane protein OmpA-like peptidoglycan-associated protein